MIEFKARKEFMDLDTEKLLARFNLESGGMVQKAIDAAVIRYDIQYVPWDTGTLARGPYSVTAIGSGEVVYPGPYAHYMYYGEVYGPNIPVFEDDSGEPTRWFSPPGREKHPTGRPLEYSQEPNPLAGSYWFERMKADHLQDIIEEARRAVGR